MAASSVEPRMIFETVHGSTAYGLARRDSDIDLKGIVEVCAGDGAEKYASWRRAMLEVGRSDTQVGSQHWSSRSMIDTQSALRAAKSGSSGSALAAAAAVS